MLLFCRRHGSLGLDLKFSLSHLLQHTADGNVYKRMGLLLMSAPPFTYLISCQGLNIRLNTKFLWQHIKTEVVRKEQCSRSAVQWVIRRNSCQLCGEQCGGAGLAGLLHSSSCQARYHTGNMEGDNKPDMSRLNNVSASLTHLLHSPFTYSFALPWDEITSKINK